jgi:hypothetical protein
MFNHKFGHNYFERISLMPSHRVHRAITARILGKPHDKVHKAIDYPYKFLGPRHRVLFHDPITAVLVSRTASKEKGAGLAAILHIVTDWTFNSRTAKLLDLFIVLRKRLHFW